MKLIINTAHQRFGGAVQVALSFIYECRNFPEHEYYVWVGSGVGKSLREDDFPPNFHFTHFDFGVITLSKAWHINRCLRREEQKIKPDVVIATSGPSYFHSTSPQIIGFNLPLYIYPESPYLLGLPLYRRLRLQIKKRLHYYFFKRDAVAYVVQTEDVNQRVRKALGTDQVFTVSNTHNGFYNDWKPWPPRLPSRFQGEVRLLTLSAYYAHKNLELIPQVLQELRRRGRIEIRFVLTLSDTDFQEKIGGDHDGGILNVGPQPPESCPSLYAECDMMFLPTLAECFSASYPEAMVMGKPIVTTDLGFARSICGEAALYFKPMDVQAAADEIERLFNDQDLQTQLIKKGYQQLKEFDTPRQRAQKYLGICEHFATTR